MVFTFKLFFLPPLFTYPEFKTSLLFEELFSIACLSFRGRNLNEKKFCRLNIRFLFTHTQRRDWSSAHAGGPVRRAGIFSWINRWMDVDPCEHNQVWLTHFPGKVDLIIVWSHNLCSECRTPTLPARSLCFSLSHFFNVRTPALCLAEKKLLPTRRTQRFLVCTEDSVQTCDCHVMIICRRKEIKINILSAFTVSLALSPLAFSLFLEMAPKRKVSEFRHDMKKSQISLQRLGNCDMLDRI